jgi:hypothetical protein
VLLAEDVDSFDVNITTLSDLIRCNTRERERIGLNAWISPDASVAGSARLEATVIGHRVVIEDNVSLKNVVVFECSRVARRSRVADCVITPSGLFPAVGCAASGRWPVREPLASAGPDVLREHDPRFAQNMVDADVEAGAGPGRLRAVEE